MMSSGYREFGGGQITSGIESTLTANTFAFVRRKLPEWRDDPDRPDEQAETRLNAQLCKFLDASARSEFPMVRFNREEPEAGRRQVVDISASPSESIIINAKIHTIYDPFLVFEGKRLPAPSSGREKEYVTGYSHRSGGIQRFKLGLHGAKVPVGGMIAYVQRRSAPEWHRDINRWISSLASGVDRDGCTWNASEMLGPQSEDPGMGISCCISVHGRSGVVVTSSIELHHAWVVMGAMPVAGAASGSPNSEAPAR